MDKQALNKKLVEGAGFRHSEVEGYPVGTKVQRWVAPDGSLSTELPNFTNSLDACFKWLVPNLDCFQRNRVISKWAIKLLFDKEAEPALSLCLVIEKLIDGDKEV